MQFMRKYFEQDTFDRDIASISANQIIDPEKLVIIHQALDEEFAADNVVASVIFGSTARATDKQNSDYDFTLVVRNLPDDISEREKASPRLKRRLQNLGVEELCAFNIYTPEELQSAADRNFWLLETIKAGYAITRDTQDFLKQLLEKNTPGVERIEDKFAWRGVEFVDKQRFFDSIQAHIDAAQVLADKDPELSQCHIREAERIALVARLYENGESHSRGTLYDFAYRLNQVYDEGLDLDYFLRQDLENETTGKLVNYGYENVDRHIQASKLLAENGQQTMALSHTAQALKILYLNALHRSNNFIIDGEVTQLFLKQFSQELGADLMDRIYEFSFKAEQYLGRTGYLTFDLNGDGRPYYEQINDPNFDFDNLNDALLRIISEIIVHPNISLTDKDSISDVVTLVILSDENTDHDGECLKQVNNLVFPKDRMKILVQPQQDSRAEIDKLLDSVETPHLVFIENDVIVSPLWLVNILSGFNSDKIGSVSSKVEQYDDKLADRHVTCYRTSAANDSANLDFIELFQKIVQGHPSYHRKHIQDIRGLKVE